MCKYTNICIYIYTYACMCADSVQALQVCEHA